MAFQSSPAAQPIKLLIADDHELVRDGIRARLEDRPELNIIGEARDGIEAVQKAQLLKPDVIMMDISMPHLNGLEATAQIRQADIECGIVMLSIFDSTEYVRGAIDAGANGYILKDVSSDEMLRAIITVAAGGLHLSTKVASAIASLQSNSTERDQSANKLHGLTRRELDVLKAIAAGSANKQIAHELGIAVRTVESHRQNLRDKLGGGNTVQLLKVATELGLI